MRKTAEILNFSCLQGGKRVYSKEAAKNKVEHELREKMYKTVKCQSFIEWIASKSFNSSVLFVRVCVHTETKKNSVHF